MQLQIPSAIWQMHQNPRWMRNLQWIRMSVMLRRVLPKLRFLLPRGSLMPRIQQPRSVHWMLHGVHQHQWKVLYPVQLGLQPARIYSHWSAVQKMVGTAMPHMWGRYLHEQENRKMHYQRPILLWVQRKIGKMCYLPKGIWTQLFTSLR